MDDGALKDYLAQSRRLAAGALARKRQIELGLGDPPGQAKAKGRK
jgi:hypothetical protein